MQSERETEAGSSAKGLLQTMTEISRRILTLENSSAQSAIEEASIAESRQQVRAQNLVLAVGYLRESLRSSDPFTKSLEALRALGGDDPDIMNGLKELDPFAETGIHTMDMLRRKYDTVAENIRVAASGDTSEIITKNTLSEVFDQVTSLVTVRKTGTETSENIKTNPVDTARVQLDQGDLEGAIATLSALRGSQAAFAAPWLADAQGRLIAEKTLSRLHVFVVSILATSIQ